MLISAALSGVWGIENSLGEQYLPGMCGASSFDYGAGLYALRQTNVR